MIVKIIYLLKDKRISVKKIFKQSFVKKLKYRCKILYENKLYPLKSEVIIHNKITDQIKIKLLYYNHFSYINDLIRGIESFYLIRISKEHTINYNKLKQFLKYKNMIKLIYKIKTEGERIQIFGSDFVNNNKNKCIIIYQNNIFPLQEFFSIKEKEKNKLEIILIELEDIYNRSYMFCDCFSLESFSLIEVDEKEHKEVENSEIKDFYSSDKSSEFYTNLSFSLVKRGSTMINNKNSSKKRSILNLYQYLSFIPTKFGWDTSNCIDMSNMFNGCISLISLNEISKWNTKNVINMTAMFKDCSSLKSLPDLSRWNTNNLINIKEMFSECSQLIALPDISKWNTKNIKNLNLMFKNCSSLISVPDISKWNIKNVKN